MSNTSSLAGPVYGTAGSDNATAALSASEHSQGDVHAPLILLEYGDYECPACVRAEAPTQRLIEAGGTRMRFVFRHYPWVELHPHAMLAAEAAEAAAAQGKFWPMHRQLFKQSHGLALRALTQYAEDIELDMIRFNAEMADRVYTQRVQEHRLAGEQSGLKTTPSYFLNGHPVDVSDGFDALEQALRAALAGH